MIMKNKLLYILCFFILGCDDDIEPGKCPSGTIEDDCGICDGENFYNTPGDPDSGWDCGIDNNECNQVDLCGVCLGEIWEFNDCDNMNIECCGCTSSNAANYNLNATINNNSCIYSNVYQVIDLYYLSISPKCIPNNLDNPFQQTINDECDPFSIYGEYICEDQDECRWSRNSEIAKDLAIYWINNSDISITVETIDTEQNCCNNSDNNNDTDCSSLDNDIACSTLENICDWSTCSSYNEYWNNYNETIPANTSANYNNIFLSEFFLPNGLSEIQTVHYCADINGEEQCGIIEVIE